MHKESKAGDNALSYLKDYIKELEMGEEGDTACGKCDEDREYIEKKSYA